jgi:hypothetical protein
MESLMRSFVKCACSAVDGFFKGFDETVEMLKGVFRTLRAFVEGDRVPHCFNDSEIYRIFFKFGRVNDVRYNLEGLSLDSIVEVFNPREGLVDSDFLGGDINMQMELICWFMGFIVPGRSWFPASSFKESVGGSAESVEIFDLKGSIYKTLKHRFNQAIGRAGRDSCITLRHNFARMEHGGVFFDTAVSLKMDRAELQEEHHIKRVAWSPEGHRFVSAGEEGQLHIWGAGVERPLAVAMALHARLGRGSPLAALEPELIRAIVLQLPADWGGAGPPV